jgi:thiamine kinase
MAQSLSTIHSANLTNPKLITVSILEILDEWSQWGLGLIEPPKLVGELKGGLTNHSYLLQSGPDQWVLRCNALNSAELGIDRQREQQILALTATQKLSPTPMYTNASHDYLISPYLHPWQLDIEHPLLTRDDIELLASRVRQLHDWNVSDATVYSLNYRQHSQNYLHLIVEHRSQLTDEIAALQQMEQPFLEQFQNSIERSVLCHNDLSPVHWRWQDNELCLIDWEYASLGDAAFDVAVLVQKWQLNESQIDRFLACYGGVSRQRLQLAQRVNGYISKLWFYVQQDDVGIE